MRKTPRISTFIYDLTLDRIGTGSPHHKFSQEATGNAVYSHYEQQQREWVCQFPTEAKWTAKARIMSLNGNEVSKNKQTLWPLVREQTTPTERPRLVDEI
jgi:hypothetical protein